MSGNQAGRPLRSLLVTGGAGFIGSAFIRFLLGEAGFQGRCINLDLLTYAGNLANLREVAGDSRYQFIQGDVCDGELLERLCVDYQVDTIVHFAAESHVDRSISDPGAFLHTNIGGTYQLLELMRRHPAVHLHQVSTDEVYGTLDEDEAPFHEESPYRPRSPYAASKAAADHLVRAYGNTYGLSYCLSHCGNNYGPYQFPEKLIPLFICRCLEGKPMPLYGGGQQVRDWLHVDDHVRAIWLLLSHGRSQESYAIGGGEQKRNWEVASAIIGQIALLTRRDRAELEKLLTFVEDRPGHDYRYAIDGRKMEQELGWRPSHPFEEGLKATISWYLEAEEWLESTPLSEKR